jgi:hypothetical protein
VSLRLSFGADEKSESYGVSENDRSTMLAVIRSVSKRRLARAAKVSTRSIPLDETAAKEMLVKEFGRLFDVGIGSGRRKSKWDDRRILEDRPH